MLNERPTPETDDFNCKWDSYSHPFQAIDLARKLERERDNARTELEEYRSIAENIGADKAVSEKEKAIRERDEVREAFKEMWRSGDAFLPHVDSETINRWRKAAGWEETK